MNFHLGAAWMQGEIIPIEDAKISVTDWGLTRSDITYDVVHVWEGAFFRFDDYLARFQNSVAKLRLDIDQTNRDMKKIMHDLVAKTQLKNAYCSMVASRGKPTVPGTRDPRYCDNHFYAWCVPYIHVIPPEIADRGAHLLVADNITRIPANSVDPTVKNYHWGDLTAAQFEAMDKGYNSAVLADYAGNITEGPGFNIFAVINGKVITPNSGALEGITRKTILEICSELNIPCETRPISIAEFLNADEAFTSTTAGGPVPVTRLNERILANDAPGPLTMLLKKTYWDWHMREEFRTEVDYT